MVKLPSRPLPIPPERLFSSVVKNSRGRASRHRVRPAGWQMPRLWLWPLPTDQQAMLCLHMQEACVPWLHIQYHGGEGELGVPMLFQRISTTQSWKSGVFVSRELPSRKVCGQSSLPTAAPEARQAPSVPTQTREEWLSSLEIFMSHV